MKMRTDRCLKAVKTALSVAALSVLVACGGGGSGDDTDSVTGVSLSGVAAKGLLKQAIVTAYAVNNDGSRGSVLATGRTLDNGTYTLTGLPTGQVILVEITADSTTRMVDEANNNTAVQVPSNFRIRAATVLEDTGGEGSNSLQITPFSEMAVAKAEDAGGLTEDNVEGANQDIRLYLGYDVLAEAPDFNEDGTAPENGAALMLAALSKMANEGALGCGQEDVGDRVKCLIDELAERGTDDGDLADDLEAAKDDTIDSEEYVNDDVPAAPAPQPTEIIPPSERAEGVAAAKALIDAIRDNGPLLAGDTGDTLQTRLEAVRSAFNAAINPLNGSQRALVEALGHSFSHLSAQGEFTSTYDLNVSDARGGGCTYYAQGGFSVEATNWEEVTGVGCRVTHAVIQRNSNYYAIQHNYRITPTDVTGEFNIVSRVIEQQVDAEGTRIGNPTELAGTFTGENRFEAVAVLMPSTTSPMNSITIDGRLAPNVRPDGSLPGTMAYNAVTLAIAPEPIENAEGAEPNTTLRLQGTFVARTAQGAEISRVSLNEGSYLRAQLGEAGNLDSSVTDATASAAHLDVTVSLATGEAITGVLDIGDYATDAAGQELPTNVAFNGSIVNGATTLFSGELEVELRNVGTFNSTLPESAENFLPKMMDVTGSLYVPGAAGITVNLTFTELEQYGSYGLNGRYTQGDNELLLSAFGTHGDDASTYAEFSGSTGVSMRLTTTATVYDILTEAGVVVGRFDRVRGIIDYADNTRETF